MGTVGQLLVVGYLALSLLCGLLIWLAQRTDPLRDAADRDDGGPPLVAVLLLAGLAWPLALPLIVLGWLRERASRRFADR